MERLKIGVVGLKFGTHHVRTLANMDRADLVAVADRNPAVPGGLRDFASRYGARAYADGIEMMATEELDAVSLCVSPRSREDLLNEAVRRGIPVFVEKPWAADLNQARRMADICRDHPIMVAFSFRFLPAIVRLRELMDDELGPGWVLNGRYVFQWLPEAGHWLWDPENGGGFFNENSCHLFDSVCHLMGRPTALSAHGVNFLGSPSEEAASVCMEFAGGSTAALTVGGLGSGSFLDFPSIDLITANGEARLSGRHHIWEQLLWAVRGTDAVKRLTAPAESLGSTRYTCALNHFFDCLENGSRPSATVRDGVISVAIAAAVYESARTGRRVEVDV
jgi:predicted dehydrogenase